MKKLSGERMTIPIKSLKYTTVLVNVFYLSWRNILNEMATSTLI